MPSASSTTGANCGCCHQPPTPCISLGTALLECRIRGGTATLCGFSEFVSPSSPPKKYRVKSYGGTYITCEWDDAGCSSLHSGVMTVLSGACSYDPTTCVQSSTGQVLAYQQNSVCPPGGAPGVTPNYCGDFGVGATAQAGYITQTERDRVPGSQCVHDISGVWFTSSGSLTSTLSNEDTESDAIARLLAGGGGTWGSWTAGAGVAQFEQRTTLFTFAYQEAQFRVTINGLTPASAYHVSVDIMRRAHGSGSYIKIATNIYAFTSDGSGHYQFSDTIPNVEGYDTTVGDVTTVCVYP